MANGISIKAPYCYQKGDTITLTGTDYFYGVALSNGGEIYVNVPLSKPIISGTPVATSYDAQFSLTLITGYKVFTVSNVASISIANGGLQINFHGSFDTSGLPYLLSPCIISLAMTIELQ